MRRVVSCFVAPVSSLDPALLEVVDRYWARFFGCAPAVLRSDTAQIGVHSDVLMHRAHTTGQGDYAWCYLMEFGGAPIVSFA